MAGAPPPDAPPPDAPRADASRTEARPEYARLARELAALLDAGFGVPPAAGRRVVGVAGESGSGKSATAAGLARALAARGAPAGVLHQDDYFLRPPRANHAHRLLDLAHVGPHEVDLERIAAHVAAFRAGRDGVEAPLVDYPSDSFRTHRLDFAPLRVLVVEGTYALHLPDLDVRVFLEATHEDTRERRAARNRDAGGAFVDRVLAVEHAIIRRQADAADVVIDRAFRVRRA